MTICSEHAGKHNYHNRKKLDKIMGALDDNQSGEGRHKCTYCAYEEGFREGYQSAKKESESSSIDGTN